MPWLSYSASVTPLPIVNPFTLIVPAPLEEVTSLAVYAHARTVRHHPIGLDPGLDRCSLIEPRNLHRNYTINGRNQVEISGSRLLALKGTRYKNGWGGGGSKTNMRHDRVFGGSVYSYQILSSDVFSVCNQSCPSILIKNHFMETAKNVWIQIFLLFRITRAFNSIFLSIYHFRLMNNIFILCESGVSM